MKDEAALNQFLKEEVNLNKTRYNNARDRLKTLQEHLSKELDGFVRVELQGSYATETIIKPVHDNDSYDIDVTVELADDGSSAKDYIKRVEDCLDVNAFYSDHAETRTRSVTIEYAGQFNIDVVPFVEKKGTKYICNRKTDGWEITDGTAYKEWFQENNRKSNGHLKRTVRLLKYLRDHKDTFTVSSVALTTLAGMAVQETDRERLNTLPNALEAITEWIDDYLHRHPVMDIKNPVLLQERFDRHWTEGQYENFRNRFRSYTKRIKEAIDCPDPDKSEKLWKDILGPHYKPSSRNNDGEGNRRLTSTSAAAAATPSLTPRFVRPKGQYAC